MDAYNPKRSRRYREKAIDNYWDSVDKIPDPDIKLEIRGAKRVRIIEDNTKEIEIPEYPTDSDSNY